MFENIIVFIIICIAGFFVSCSLKKSLSEKGGGCNCGQNGNGCSGQTCCETSQGIINISNNTDNQQ